MKTATILEIMVVPRTSRRRVFPRRLLGGLFSLAYAPAVFAYSASDTGKQISSDGSAGDTQAAINYVAGKNQDGWVLTVGTPGGTYNWATGISINVPHVFTVKGASPTNRPTITVTVATGTGIGMTCADGKTLTLQDFVFNEWPQIGLIYIGGSGTDCFRLTNLKFNHTNPTTTVSIGSLQPTATGIGPYGLIDHCQITGPGSGYGFYVRENQQPEVGFVPGSWGRPMSWGTKQAVYIEDCNFSSTSYTPGRPAVDSDNGGRLVFRHNILVNQTAGTHGADSPGPVNSVLQCEVMHNSFSFNDPTGAGYPVDNLFFLRGGTAAVFDNTWSVTNRSEVHCITKIYFYRAFAGDPHTPQDRLYPQDYVGTQQPGMGVVSSNGGDPKFPNRPWGSVPIYSWGNHPGGPMGNGEISADGSGFEQANRDYFLGTAKPGYTELTYPHPLQNGGSSSTLAPPTGLTVSGG